MLPEVQDLTSKIGLRVRKARHAQKLSLVVHSDRTGGALSKSRISNYELGFRRLGLEEARVLAQALGRVSAAHLLCLDDEGFLSDQERELVRCFRRTDERGRGTILGVAESQCEGPGGDALP
jgi:transcriptional regulator with XRE-family HTH domain